MPARQERQAGAGNAGTQQGDQQSGQETRAGERAARGTGGTDVERNIPVSGESGGGQTQRQGEGRGLTRASRSAPLGSWDLMRLGPWELMRRMSEEFDQLFGGYPFAGRGGLLPQQAFAGLTPRAGFGSDTFVPQMDVIRRQNEIVVRADLPGLEPDDIEINVEDDMLTISGERRSEQREERGGVLRTERSYGSFERTLPLPAGVDPEKVAATFRNGVLEVTVPVSGQRERGRRVTIQR